MNQLEAMKAVYCYLFPEIRPLLREVEEKVGHRIFLTSTPARTVYADLESLLTPPLDIPALSDGRVDVDMMHVPIIERIVDAYSSAISDLSGFRHSYPTSGSNEGIFHIMAKLKTTGVSAINVLTGEYEGYAAQARNLGIDVVDVDPEKADIDKLEPAFWFISNPSARNGNIIPNDFIHRLCENGHKVVADFAYVGATKPHSFDASHKNIIAAVMSLSKPFGLFRYRIGFAFSREELPSLYGNKWFKDTIRLIQGLKIVERFGTSGLYATYRPVQETIVDELNEKFGIGMKASDAFLLSHITNENAARLSPEKLELINEFRRGGGYRFCLTPYFEKREGVKNGN